MRENRKTPKLLTLGFSLFCLFSCSLLVSCDKEEEEDLKIEQGNNTPNDNDSNNDNDEEDKWHVIECTWCKGSGVCRKCNGDGLDAYDRECDSCHGSAICSHCDGTGEIWFQ